MNNVSLSQNERDNARNGNKNYLKGLFAESEVNYRKSLSKNQLIVSASTGSNYGDLTEEISTEETPLKPLSIYGVTKTKSEEIL